MARPDSSRVLFAELIFFAQDLSGTNATEAQELQRLLKGIRKAFEDERKEAMAEVEIRRSKLQESEHLCLKLQNDTIELVNVKGDYARLMQQLEQVKDENGGVRSEVDAFETREMGSRKRKGPASVEGTAEGPVPPLSNEYASTPDASEISASSQIPRGPQRQCPQLQPFREVIEHSQGPRHSIASSSILNAAPMPNAALGTGHDLYRPEEAFTSPNTLSNKRLRTSSTTEPSPHAADLHHSNLTLTNSKSTTDTAQLASRVPVCGLCVKSHSRHACDGRTRCTACARQNLRNCVYTLCTVVKECTAVKCDLLHPQQWDQEKELGVRKVRAQWRSGMDL